MLKIFLTVFIISASVWAAIPPISIDAKMPGLKVALSDIAPYSYSENGQLKGINYEIFDHITKATGIKLDYALYPHARVKSLLPTDDPDLVILFAPACLQNKADYEIQTKLYRMKSILYLKQGIGHKNKDIRVGRVRGTCVSLMKENVKPGNVFETSDLKQLLEMVELGRLEGICALDTLMDYNLKKYPTFVKDKLVVYKTQTHVSDFDAVLCRKKNLPVAVKAKLDQAMKNYKYEIF